MAVIAVDGPAASGKGTLARRLAEHFGYHWLDTGLLYRAVAWRMPAGDAGQDPARAIAVARDFDAGWLGAPELRGEAASERAFAGGGGTVDRDDHGFTTDRRRGPASAERSPESWWRSWLRRRS